MSPVTDLSSANNLGDSTKLQAKKPTDKEAEPKAADIDTSMQAQNDDAVKVDLSSTRPTE